MEKSGRRCGGEASPERRMTNAECRMTNDEVLPTCSSDARRRRRRNPVGDSGCEPATGVLFPPPADCPTPLTRYRQCRGLWRGSGGACSPQERFPQRSGEGVDGVNDYVNGGVAEGRLPFRVISRVPRAAEGVGCQVEEPRSDGVLPTASCRLPTSCSVPSVPLWPIPSDPSAESAQSADDARCSACPSSWLPGLLSGHLLLCFLCPPLLPLRETQSEVKRQKAKVKRQKSKVKSRRPWGGRFSVV